MTPFERKIIRLRNRIEKRGITMAKKMIKQQYDFLAERIQLVTPDNIYQVINAIPEQSVKNFFLDFYPKMAPLGVLWRNKLLKRKDAEDDFFQSTFADQLRQFVEIFAGEKITSITETTRKVLTGLVKDEIALGFEQGLSIDAIKKNILTSMGDSLGKNAAARARAIAQTETIAGSNHISMRAAESTGLEFRKFWSTSGLPGIRPTHMAAESYSEEVGGLRQDQLFPNGLRYPGDPDGAADEVINCRCTLLLEAQ